MLLTLLNIYRSKLVISKSLHTLIFNIVAIPISIGTSIFIARVLGTTGKGSYDLILSTTSLLSIILGLSLRSGITYIVASKNINIRKLFPKLILFATGQSLIAIVFLFVIKNYDITTAFIPFDLSYWSIVLVPLLLFTITIDGYLASILIGLKENIILNNINFISKITVLILLSLGTAIIYFLKLTANPILFLIINIIASFISIIILYQNTQKKIKSNQPNQKTVESKIFQSIFNYSLPCYLGNLLQFCNYKIDIFIVSFLTDVAQLGMYTLAVSLAQLIWLISNSCATVLLPKISTIKHNKNQTIAYTAQITRIILFLSIITSICLAIFIYFMLPVLYGENFRGSIAPFMFLLPGIAFFSIARILGAYMAGIGNPKVNTIASSLGFIGTIMFDIILIPQHEIIGAAIASSISYFISTIILIYFFIKKSKLKINHLFIIQSEDIYLCVSIVKQFSKKNFISS